LTRAPPDVDVRDDEFGQETGVEATLAVEEEG
jgi:hypothetical protein